MADMKLKNCPLCNSDNVEVASSAAYRVKCFTCYTSGSFGDREEAIKAWNTRASDATLEAQEAEIKRLRSALKGLSDMYTAVFDMVDGDLIMMDEHVELFEKRHAIAQAALKGE